MVFCGYIIKQDTDCQNNVDQKRALRYLKFLNSITIMEK